MLRTKESGSLHLERAAWLNSRSVHPNFQLGPAGRSCLRRFGQPFVHQDLDLHTAILLTTLTGRVISDWLLFPVAEGSNDPPQRDHMVFRKVLHYCIGAAVAQTAIEILTPIRGRKPGDLDDIPLIGLGLLGQSIELGLRL